MKRKYDSSRRAAHATQTQQAIIEATVRLHGQGITTVAAVAEEAGVSLPTVSKYFPTREDLFKACTTHMAQSLRFRRPDELAAIADAGERLSAVVREVYTLHETTFGQSWTGYKLEEESPVMDEAMANYEALVNTFVEALPNLDDGDTTRSGFARALLNPLAYRALRLKGGLDFEAAVRAATAVLACLLSIE